MFLYLRADLEIKYIYIYLETYLDNSHPKKYIEVLHINICVFGESQTLSTGSRFFIVHDTRNYSIDFFALQL